MLKLILPLALITLTISAQKSGIVVANMDAKVNPANDFYNFANGTWQKNFKLPESDARYGSFNEINDNNLKKIKLIYNDVSKNTSAPSNSNLQRLRDFYNTGLDSVLADKLGYEPIKPQLDEIAKVNTVEDFMKLKVSFAKIGVQLLYNHQIIPDLKNSKRHKINFEQGGFGLGDKDYYYSDKFSKIRTEYISTYLAGLFQITGVDETKSKQNAKLVYEVEEKIASASLTKLEQRDIEKMYNLFTLSTLKTNYPNLNWSYIFDAYKLNEKDTVVITSENYFKSLNDILSNYPIEQLKLYATAQLLMEAAPTLSSNFFDVHFAFRGKEMSGLTKPKVRWQRVNSYLSGYLGEIIGEEFVKRYFPEVAKQKTLKMIDNLILAYRDRIKTRTWMSDQTKNEAYRKLDLLIKKVGYPDKWTDFTSLTIQKENFWKNMCNTQNFLFNKGLKDLRKPVDRYKFQMSPVMVNAYYDPTTNEICFPAAILQPPFFDADAEDAANYGTMGAIIGHELTHGFDDQGSQFDADGNMKMWWTEKDYENFKNRKQQIINQFDAFEALPNLKVSGSMTQGENIADLGGLTMAYNGYIKTLNGKPSKKIDGYTGEQRFFIAWAQGWKTICRDEEMKKLVTTDYHAPGYFRAFAPLTNLPEFYKAFNVKEGDKMFTPADKRVEVW